MKTKIQFSKQILSIALCLAMFLSYVPMSVFAANEHSHPVCGASHTDIGDHTGDCSNIAWRKWESTTTMPTEAGAYYLANNVELSATWEIPEGIEISLCLNGHSVSGNNAVRVITVGETAKLNVCDCSAEQSGKVTQGFDSSGSGGGVYVYQDAALNFFGGNITNNEAKLYGGGVYIYYGTFNMYGGSVSSNKSQSYGGGIYNCYGYFNLYSGNISENTATGGGGAVFSSGTFTMIGGTIFGNTVTKSDRCWGGGVYVNGTYFEMSGGNIENNSADEGKGIFVASAGELQVIDSPSIKDNIYLDSYNNRISYIKILGPLDTNASISSTNRTIGEAFVKGTDAYSITENDAAKFTTTSGRIVLDKWNNRLVLCDDTHPAYENGACKTCEMECMHTLAYKKTSEFVVEETCTADSNCGHSATATLAVKENSYAYASIQITPATITYSDNWQGKKTTEISYSNNLNASTEGNPATASITVEDQTLTATFQIAAVSIADAAVTLNPENGTYTGTAYEPQISVVWNGATLVEDTDYKVSWTKTGYLTPDTYTASVGGIGNFTGSVDKSFTINAASLSDVKVEQTETLTYTGQAQTPTVSASAVAVNNQPISFTYSTEENGTYGDMPSFTDAGTYTVYYKAFAPNHNDKFGSFTVTVQKATVTEPTIANKVYTGSIQTADIVDADLYTVEQNNGGVDAGSYDVVLKLKDSDNYKWAITDDAEVTVQFVISTAENAWTVAPSISSWTYGETAKSPTYEAKFGTIKVTYTGKANDGSDYNSETAPTKAGNYTAAFAVESTGNYSGLSKSVDFTIEKATYEMSTAKWNYTEAFNFTGHMVEVSYVLLPTGVKVVSYEGNTGTDVGDYVAKATLSYDEYNFYAPVAEDLHWKIVNNWYPTEYSVSGTGWLNEDFVITAQDGYKVSLTNTKYGRWADTITCSSETDNGSITFYMQNESNYLISNGVTVGYKLDKTAPTGKVEFVNRTGWQEFINTISFGLFYKDEVTVKITGKDNLSGVATVEYFASSEALTLDDVKAITTWTEYNGEFGVPLEDAKKFIYFVRITDNAGNVTYLSTDGAEYDITAPVISGITSGETYYTTQKFTVTDSNGVTVKVNESEVADYTLAGNTDTTYGVVATDAAGNRTEVTVTIKTIASVYDAVKDVTAENVDNEAAEKLEKAQEVLETILTDSNATDTEKAEIQTYLDKITVLTEEIAATYKITNGADSSWTKGSSSTLGFTANGLSKFFKEVRIDDTVITLDTDYTTQEDTIVTLKAAYLNKLSTGTHKIEIVFDVLGKEAVAECSFTVKAAPVSESTSTTVHTHSWSELKSDATTHYYECSSCGAKDEVTKHSYNAAGKCTACGYYNASAVTQAATTEPTATPEPTETPVEIPTEADTTIKDTTAKEAVVEAAKENIKTADGTATVDKSAVEAIVEANGEENTVVLPLTETTEDVVNKAEIDTEALADIAESGKDIVIQFTDATVKLEAEAVKEIAQQANGKTVEIRAVEIELHHLNDHQQKEMEDVDHALILQLQVYSDGEHIGNFDGGRATIVVPFEIEEGTYIEDYSVYFIDDNGVLHDVAHEYVDGHMIFTTIHFSEYVIAHHAKADVPQTVVPEAPQAQNSLPIIPVILVVITAILFIFVLARKKREE